MKPHAVFVILVLSLSVSCLADVAFDQFTPTLRPGPASFGFTITNTGDSSASIEVSFVSYPEGQPSYLDLPPGYEALELAPGESKKLWLNYTISDIAEEGTHIISVEVVGDFMDFAAAEYSIVGTLKTFSMNVVACTDPCDSYTTAFLLEESPIKIMVLNSEGAQLSGSVTLPSGGVQDLSFFQDTAILPIDDVGRYEVQVTASKAGYQTDQRTIEIGVIEELPEVIQDTPCNTNGVCDPLETPEECPSECGPGAGQTEAGGTGTQETGERAAEEGGGVDVTVLMIIVLIVLIAAVGITSQRAKKE